jgi:hypothetical protein
MRARRMSPAGSKRLRRRLVRRATAEAVAEAVAEAAEAAEAADTEHAELPDPSRTGGGEAPLIVTITEATEGACAVCRDEWQAGAQVRVLPCGHRFHPACVGAWLNQYKDECPLCRARVPERAAPRRALGLFLELDAHGPGLGAALH